MRYNFQACEHPWHLSTAHLVGMRINLTAEWIFHHSLWLLGRLRRSRLTWSDIEACRRKTAGFGCRSSNDREVEEENRLDFDQQVQGHDIEQLTSSFFKRRMTHVPCLFQKINSQTVNRAFSRGGTMQWQYTLIQFLSQRSHRNANSNLKDTQIGVRLAVLPSNFLLPPAALLVGEQLTDLLRSAIALQHIRATVK